MRFILNRFLKNIPTLHFLFNKLIEYIDSKYYSKHCKNYTIIPFGNFCMPRVITTLSRLKPRKFYGEKTCPLDLCFALDFSKNTELLENHFSTLWDDIELRPDTKMWCNKKLNITFNHEIDISLDKLKAIINPRIKNLYEYINDKTKHLYFVIGVSKVMDDYMSYHKGQVDDITQEKIEKFIEVVKKYRNPEDFDIIFINQTPKKIQCYIKNVHIINLTQDKDFNIANRMGDWVNELIKQKRKETKRFYQKLSKELYNIIQGRYIPARFNFKFLCFKITMKNPKFMKFIKEQNEAYENNSPEKNFPTIISKEDTLDILINSNKSLARFGDGEFALIDGATLGFQSENKELARKLKNILQEKNENLLVGIPKTFASLEKFEPIHIEYWRKWVVANRNKLYSMLNMSKTYCNSFISRPYMIYKDKKNVGKYFQKMKQIWDKKDIVIVEGEYSRLGVGNDLFDNSKTIKRILAASKNAYSKFYEILDYCKTFPKETLFILALGPTATALAGELAQNGYRALDLGNIDTEYMWFLQKAKRKVPIKNKFVWEANCGEGVGVETDSKYLNEIVAKFIN